MVMHVHAAITCHAADDTIAARIDLACVLSGARELHQKFVVSLRSLLPPCRSVATCQLKMSYSAATFLLALLAASAAVNARGLTDKEVESSHFNDNNSYIKKKVILTSNAPSPLGPYSQVNTHFKFVFSNLFVQQEVTAQHSQLLRVRYIQPCSIITAGSAPDNLSGGQRHPLQCALQHAGPAVHGDLELGRAEILPSVA